MWNLRLTADNWTNCKCWENANDRRKRSCNWALWLCRSFGANKSIRLIDKKVTNVSHTNSPAKMCNQKIWLSVYDLRVSRAFQSPTVNTSQQQAAVPLRTTTVHWNNIIYTVRASFRHPSRTYLSWLSLCIEISLCRQCKCGSVCGWVSETCSNRNSHEAKFIYIFFDCKVTRKWCVSNPALKRLTSCCWPTSQLPP